MFSTKIEFIRSSIGLRCVVLDTTLIYQKDVYVSSMDFSNVFDTDGRKYKLFYAGVNVIVISFTQFCAFYKLFQ